MKSGSFGFFLLCIDRLRFLKLHLFSYLEWSERKVKKSKVVEVGKIYLHTKKTKTADSEIDLKYVSEQFVSQYKIWLETKHRIALRAK